MTDKQKTFNFKIDLMRFSNWLELNHKDTSKELLISLKLSYNLLEEYLGNQEFTFNIHEDNNKAYLKQLNNLIGKEVKE